MESRIGVLQSQISERILDYRTQGELTAPEGDADEALEQDDPTTP